MCKICCCDLGETVANDLGRHLYAAVCISYKVSHGIEATHYVSELLKPENVLEVEVHRR
jgi:hypothetical protein